MAMAVSIMSLLLVILMEFLCLVHALKFYVGGDDGWTLKPSENYIHWDERYRFQVNDEIVFKYKKEHDSVLVVSENDYSKCNKENPIKILKDGDSKFKFEKSGPFFFISGQNQNCEKGQKLIVVVLSDRHRNTTHNAPSLPPETSLKPPSSSPSPSPATTKTVPPVKPPSHSPSPSPAINKPPTKAPITHHSPTPSPAAKSPTHAPPVKPPSHSLSPSPVAPPPITHHSPIPSPAAKSPTHAPRVKPPSHSASPSPAAPAPITHYSPTPSPAAKIPLHAPPAQQHSNSPAPSPAAKSTTHVPPSRSPSPSSHKHSPSPSTEAESPKKHNGAPQPDHYAPARISAGFV
ncbi:hypothetical protein ACP275_13G046500 [Erythranthe tilingii]